MLTRHAPEYVVRRPDQLRALRSPVRQEVVDLVVAGGPRSVAELARALGRPADALYYHVRRLQRVGLLVPAGLRRRGARGEEVVDVPGRPVKLDERLRSARQRPAVEKIVATMLRLTARQHAAALRRRTAPAIDGRRNEWASRVSGWLAPEELQRFMRALDRQNRVILSRPRGGSRRLVAFTFVVAPLTAASARRPRGPAR